MVQLYGMTPGTRMACLLYRNLRTNRLSTTWRTTILLTRSFKLIRPPLSYRSSEMRRRTIASTTNLAKANSSSKVDLLYYPNLPNCE
ncbi:hypothetical protein PZA11_008020 [Diplocarpon coronariae]